MHNSPRATESADRQPDAQTTNRRIGDKSYKPETGNTRKNKFSRNKTSTYSARKGGLSPFGSRLKSSPFAKTIHLWRIHRDLLARGKTPPVNASSPAPRQQ